MTTGSRERRASRILCGLALGGIATSTVLVAMPTANGVVASPGTATAPVRSAVEGDKCRHSSQLFRCAGIRANAAVTGGGYIADYARGRNYAVGVSDVRLQKWNYSTDRWQTKKVNRDYDGFHATKDAAYVDGPACVGKWRTVAEFRWHRTGRSKVRSMKIKGHAAWCG
ncbi:MAG: hypothetical protein ACRD0P_27060 [Stackebrandtia sp.]